MADHPAISGEGGVNHESELEGNLHHAPSIRVLSAVTKDRGLADLDIRWGRRFFLIRLASAPVSTRVLKVRVLNFLVRALTRRSICLRKF